MLAAKNRHIGSALDYLKIISLDEKARMAYEAREAELMDQRTRIKSAYSKGKAEGKAEGKVGGRAEGKAEGKAEIIQAMLSKGMSVEDIASIISMDVRSVIETVSARTN